MLSVRYHGISADKPLQLSQKSIYIRRKFSYAFGGTEENNLVWGVTWKPDH